MFLPIAARELTVAARRPGTYRARFLAVLVVVAALAWQIAETRHRSPLVQGGTIFSWVTFVAWLFCFLSGTWLTSDCISEERRGGTLGLLFLTRLKGRDVTLGKMAGRSLNALYGLIAILPVLAVPIMMGGVRMEQVLLSALTLFLTLLFSLATGMFISGVNTNERKAIFYTVLLLLLFFFGPILLAVFVDEVVNLIDGPEVWAIIFPSPAFTIGMAIGFWRNLWPSWTVWLGLGSLFFSTLVLIRLANWRVARRWRRMDLGSAGLSQARKAAIDIDPFPAERRELLERNPFLWLAYRDRSKSRTAWFFVLSILFLWVVMFLALGKAVFEPGVGAGAALVVNGFLKFWIISETCTRISEDKKSGAFELLLATPLEARAIMGGVGLSLMRQFWRPILVLIALESVPLVLFYGDTSGDLWYRRTLVNNYLMLVSSVILLLADSLAIYLVGMWLALRTKSYTQAVVLTTGAVLVLPGILHMQSSAAGSLPSILPVSLLVDVGLGTWAYRRLTREFRSQLTEQSK